MLTEAEETQLRNDWDAEQLALAEAKAKNGK